MASYFFSPVGNSAQITATGAPLNAGTITTFQAGTSTPVATYTDNAGSNGAVSLTLNTLGLPSSPVWLLGGQAVKFVVKDSLGNLIRTIDNVVGINDPIPAGVTLGSDGTFDFRNRLMNGNFSINQRVVSGTVTLAAGVYGHDRWKAGAGGCTYTFTVSGNSTVITISAGTLMQVVEAGNVEGGFYVLQNAGTAQARIAVSGGATSGAFAAATKAAPLASASATANQTMTVEFTTGTIDRAQLEPGTVATPFERRPYGAELALCQRYYWRGLPCLSFNYPSYVSGAVMAWPIRLPQTMRAVPTLTITDPGVTLGSTGTPSITNATADGFKFLTISTAIAGNATITFATTDFIEASAEL